MENITIKIDMCDNTFRRDDYPCFSLFFICLLNIQGIYSLSVDSVLEMLLMYLLTDKVVAFVSESFLLKNNCFFVRYSSAHPIY